MLLFYPTVLQGVAALNAKITKCDAVSHIGEKNPRCNYIKFVRSALS